MAANRYHPVMAWGRGRFSALALFLAGLHVAVPVISPPVQAGEDRYAAIQGQVAACAACHGDKGQSVIPQNPILAGQHLHYTYVQLKDMKSGARANELMQGLVAPLEREQLLLLAEYYSRQEWKNPDHKASSGQIARAKRNITAGQCVQCHLGGFEGASGVPRVAGQHYEYLRKTMMDFKTRDRTNSAAKNSLFETISDEDIEALAAYFASM